MHRHSFTRGTRRVLGALVVCALVIAAFSATAGAAVTYTLDSRDSGTGSYSAVTSTGTIATNKRVVAEVQGTLSYWSKTMMAGSDSHWNTICGTPAAAPLFKSLGYGSSSQGRVGLDPEFIFARPWVAVSCNRRPWPIHWANFEASSTSSNSGYSHPTTLGPVTAATSDHSYSYPFVGHNSRLYFRLKETGGFGDNYGELHIQLRDAVDADCAGNGFTLMGYATQAACTAAL